MRDARDARDVLRTENIARAPPFNLIVHASSSLAMRNCEDIWRELASQ